MTVKVLIWAAAWLTGHAAATTATWPEWRGPNSDGRVEDPSFRIGPQDGLRIVWKRKLGTGYSSVSAVPGHVVTLFGDGKSDYVVSLDPDSGAEQWKYRLGPTFRAPIQSNDGPSSTPAISGDMVFALGPNGRFVGLELSGGKLCWSHDLNSEFHVPAPYFGFATSPIADEGSVYLQAGGPGGTILAFEAHSGTLRWAAGDDSVTYQSPVVARLAGEKQLVAAGDRYLFGLELSSGRILWKVEHGVRADADAVKQVLLGPGDLNPISPVAIGEDRLILTNYYNPRSVMFKVSRSAGSYSVDPVWRNGNLRRSYTVPVLEGDGLFGYNSRFAACVNPSNGNLLWRSRMPGDASLIALNGVLVFLTKDEGGLHVAKASTAGYEELASLAVFDDLTWTPPSYGMGRIFARNFHEIAAIGLAPGGAGIESDGGIPGGSTSPFLRFISLVQRAPLPERQKMVDQFILAQRQFPVIEGERTAHVVFKGQVKDVAVEGDMLEAGEQAPMHHIDGTDFYYASFDLEPDARVDYKISKDFKSSLDLDSLNPRKVGVPGAEYSEIRMPRWKYPAYLSVPVAESGELVAFELTSQALGAKSHVSVYLPPGYQNSADRYPVLYVGNGSQALQYGKCKDTLDAMIAARRIPPSLAVFFETTNRFEDMAGGRRDLQSKMIAEELVPLIDERYRTIQSYHARAIAGPDLAGYSAIHTAITYPRTFGFVAGQSTHLFGPLGGEELTRQIRQTPSFDARFLLIWGKYDLRGRGVQRRPGMMDWRKDGRDFVALLQSQGWSAQGREVAEGWGWSSWRDSFEDVLEGFLQAPVQ